MNSKRVTVVIDIGSVSDHMLTDEAIKDYIEGEMECIYSIFKVISVKTEVPDDTNEAV